MRLDAFDEFWTDERLARRHSISRSHMTTTMSFQSVGHAGALINPARIHQEPVSAEGTLRRFDTLDP